MRGVRISRLLIPIAAILLVAALVWLAGAFTRWNSWRLPPDERAYVERALREGAAIFRDTPEGYRRATRPIVTRHADRICITLATSREDGGGSYRACYDRKSGRVLEAVEWGVSFGSERISDRLRALIW